MAPGRRVAQPLLNASALSVAVSRRDARALHEHHADAERNACIENACNEHACIEHRSCTSKPSLNHHQLYGTLGVARGRTGHEVSLVARGMTRCARGEATRAVPNHAMACIGGAWHGSPGVRRARDVGGWEIHRGRRRGEGQGGERAVGRPRLQGLRSRANPRKMLSPDFALGRRRTAVMARHNLRLVNRPCAVSTTNPMC